MKRFPIIGILLMAIISAFTVSSDAKNRGKLEKVWEVDLGKLRHAIKDSGFSDIRVYSLSFSLDGNAVAAVIGNLKQYDSIIIFDAANPKRDPRIIDVSSNNYHYLGESQFGMDAVSWSPDESRMLLGSTVINLTNGNSCTFPQKHLVGQGGLYLSSNRIVALKSLSNWALFFDSDCRNIGQSVVSDYELLFDASSERNLFCIGRSFNNKYIRIHNTAVLVIDGTNRKPILQIPCWGESRFLESGNVVCGIYGKEWDQKVGCWDVKTGFELASSEEYTHLDIRPAIHSSRLVLSEYGRALDLVDFFWYVSSLKRRIVWDFRTGIELVSWEPESQKIVPPLSDFETEAPCPFAISPDGEYIVEGSGSALYMYRIEP